MRRLDNRGAALVTTLAVFALLTILAMSITSVVLYSVNSNKSRQEKDQAYLTAKSALMATVKHIERNRQNPAELQKFIGKQSSVGTLEDMGTYTVEIRAKGQNTVEVIANGYYKEHSARLVATVDGIGSAQASSGRAVQP